MSASGTAKCKSCGTKLLGHWCHKCGEKRLTAADKSVRKWLKDFFSDVWTLDGKLIKTLKYLLVRPGILARDVVQGRRKPYVKPINIFLIANLLYFVSPAFDTFKTSLFGQMHNHAYSPLVAGVVEGRLDKEQSSLEELQLAYDGKTSEVSKLIIIILAPLMGLLLYSLFKRQGLYLSDGFNLGFQFWAFFMLVFMVVLPALSRAADRWFGSPFFTTELVVSVSAMLLSGIYLFFQLRFWADIRKWKYTGKILVLMTAFLPLLVIYRFILFWVTYLLI